MKSTRKIVSLVLAVVLILSVFIIMPISASATNITADQAISWCQSKLGQGVEYSIDKYRYQCVDFIQAYYAYLGVTPSSGSGYEYATNNRPDGWERIKGGTPQKGDILVYTGGWGHVAIYESDNVSYHQNWNYSYVQKVNRPYNKSFTVTEDGKTVTKTYWGCIHPNFNGGTPVFTDEITTPTISFDKNTYVIGETARITWVASSTKSNFKHYWLVITNTTSGKQYYGTATGGDGDINQNYYNLVLNEAGTYKADVYAVDHNGGGKSDSKTFNVAKYELTTPTISFNKSSYIIGETAKISWIASSSESNFKHYWLVITNTTSGKQYYGTATGGNGDISKNYYDLTLTEAGTYKVDVYAVDQNGGGKSDSKSFGVGKNELTTPIISFDKSSYVIGNTAKISWVVSSSESDFKHYWLVITNTTIGKQYYGTATGGDGDVSKNYYDLVLTEPGTYKVDVYAVDHNGGGKSDSKNFNVDKYELTTPTISFDKNSYVIGETAKITWDSSLFGSDFKHYWLVIKNTTCDKQYYGTATGGDGDVSKNYYDLALTEPGTYKVDVYAVDHNGDGKSDSKNFIVYSTPQPTETQPVTDAPTEPTTNKPTDTTQPVEKKDISDWEVIGLTNKVYTGKAITQKVAVTNDSEYATFDISYKNNVNVGNATVIIKGKGNYTGTIVETFKITKANNPIKVKAKTITTKAKKTLTFAKSKSFTLSKAQSAVSFKRVSGDKRITISKEGKITVKKGLKKGKTYSFKVKVTAAGTKNYKSVSKTVTVKIKVK